MRRRNPAVALQPPRPQLTVIVDVPETTAAARLLQRANRPEVGWVVASVAAGTRSVRWLASRLLSALNKEGDQRGDQRNQSRDWTYAEAWLAGYGIQHLVIDRAHLLDLRLAKVAFELADRLGLQLTLLASPQHWRPTARRGIDALDPRRSSWSDLLSALPTEPARTGPVLPRRDPVAGLGPADIPWVDWFAFPAALAEYPDRAVGDRLEEVRCRAAREAAEFFAIPGSTAESEWLPWVVDKLRLATVAERISMLRGFQVGAFVNGKHMKVDVAAAIGALEADGDQPTPSEPVLQRLMRFRGPIVATLGAVLCLGGMTAEAVVGMTGADLVIDESGAAVLVDDQLRRLPATVAPAGRAYRYWRAVHGFADSDPLWVRPNLRPYRDRRDIRRLLGKLSIWTGVAFVSRYGRHNRISNWRSRLGVNVQDICS